MKKVLLVVVAVLALVSARAAFAACPVGTHPVCNDNGTTPPDPTTGQACGETDIIPGVLEIAGCANQTGVNGCIGVAETVGLGGGSALPPGGAPAPIIGDEPGCDAAANAACDACGCATCQADES